MESTREELRPARRRPQRHFPEDIAVRQLLSAATRSGKSCQPYDTARVGCQDQENMLPERRDSRCACKLFAGQEQDTRYPYRLLSIVRYIGTRRIIAGVRPTRVVEFIGQQSFRATATLIRNCQVDRQISQDLCGSHPRGIATRYLDLKSHSQSMTDLKASLSMKWFHVRVQCMTQSRS